MRAKGPLLHGKTKTLVITNSTETLESETEKNSALKHHLIYDQLRFDNSSNLDEVEHFYDGLCEILDNLTMLNIAVHDLCNNAECDTVVPNFEYFIEHCKRTISITKNLITQW
ncbi:hypothetical protein C0J52_26548 [Blattella germanica]|nr:hypothetical protein C0J52_26548 [Blattella germanica]